MDEIIERLNKTLDETDEKLNRVIERWNDMINQIQKDDKKATFRSRISFWALMILVFLTGIYLMKSLFEIW